MTLGLLFITTAPPGANSQLRHLDLWHSIDILDLLCLFTACLSYPVSLLLLVGVTSSIRPA